MLCVVYQAPYTVTHTEKSHPLTAPYKKPHAGDIFFKSKLDGRVITRAALERRTECRCLVSESERWALHSTIRVSFYICSILSWLSFHSGSLGMDQYRTSGRYSLEN